MWREYSIVEGVGWSFNLDMCHEYSAAKNQQPFRMEEPNRWSLRWSIDSPQANALIQETDPRVKNLVVWNRIKRARWALSEHQDNQLTRHRVTNPSKTFTSIVSESINIRWILLLMITAYSSTQPRWCFLQPWRGLCPLFWELHTCRLFHEISTRPAFSSSSTKRVWSKKLLLWTRSPRS